MTIPARFNLHHDDMFEVIKRKPTPMGEEIVLGCFVMCLITIVMLWVAHFIEKDVIGRVREVGH